MSALANTPATLQAAVETETEFGGRIRDWTVVAHLWTTLRITAPHPEQGGDRPPETSETATAVARDHPAAEAGQQLCVGDAPPWTVVAVRRAQPGPGAMTLILDRLL